MHRKDGMKASAPSLASSTALTAGRLGTHHRHSSSCRGTSAAWHLQAPAPGSLVGCPGTSAPLRWPAAPIPRGWGTQPPHGRGQVGSSSPLGARSTSSHFLKDHFEAAAGLPKEASSTTTATSLPVTFWSAAFASRAVRRPSALTYLAAFRRRSSVFVHESGSNHTAM
jgi:hypothetical protein